jgi:hypothetical protein
MKPAHVTLLFLGMISVSWLNGCGKVDSPENKTDTLKGSTTGSGDGKQQAGAGTGDHGHSHERGKMLLADVGQEYHALLTAHLSSKDGNELDVFFETSDDKAPVPAAIPVESFTGQVRVTGEDQSKEVKFEPAPKEERPKGEKPGACSHFIAKVPWMKASDNLSIVIFLTLEGERYRVVWENFNPKKYAHHED